MPSKSSQRHRLLRKFICVGKSCKSDGRRLNRFRGIEAVCDKLWQRFCAAGRTIYLTKDRSVRIGISAATHELFDGAQKIGCLDCRQDRERHRINHVAGRRVMVGVFGNCKMFFANIDKAISNSRIGKRFQENRRKGRGERVSRNDVADRPYNGQCPNVRFIMAMRYPTNVANRLAVGCQIRVQKERHGSNSHRRPVPRGTLTRRANERPMSARSEFRQRFECAGTHSGDSPLAKPAQKMVGNGFGVNRAGSDNRFTRSERQLRIVGNP